MERVFDFSKYDKDRVLFDDSRASHLFDYKDEPKGKAAITQFIGLRPKCCSMAAKDLKTSIKNHLTFDDYKKC